MRRIAIVGGSQSGLQLGLGLLQNHYEVTVVSNRTPEQILSGRVTSSQFMFHDSLQNERDLGINFWEKECPITEGIAFTIPGPEKTKALFWEAKLDGYGQSIDQRVKFAGWMKEFAKRGGNLVIKDAGPQDVDGYAKSHDLVLVAAGKGEINRMFERDAEKSPFDQPMRALALTYVKNMVPRKPFTAVSFNLVPGVGEYFVFPALTTTGTCEIMVFEGVPGGPMDCWNDVKSSEEHLAKSKWVRSEEHTSELQSPCNLVCRLLLEKKKKAWVNFTFRVCGLLYYFLCLFCNIWSFSLPSRPNVKEGCEFQRYSGALPAVACSSTLDA